MQNFLNIASTNLANPEAPTDSPWYVKYGARGFGTIAGGMAMFMGALNTITSIFSPLCIVLSIWQIVLGFIVISLESPCCCFFIDHVQILSQKLDGKPIIYKAAGYVLGPLPVLIWCFGFATVFGSGLVLGAGVMYGFIGLGKKASRDEMAARAAQSNNASSTLPYFNLFSNTTSSTDSPNPNPKANLVENEQISAWQAFEKKEPSPPTYNSAMGQNQQQQHVVTISNENSWGTNKNTSYNDNSYNPFQ